MLSQNYCTAPSSRMGGCCCKAAGGSGLEVPVIIPGGREAVAQTAAAPETAPPWWTKKPRVELGNDSEYRVSYWVLQDDKVKTSAINERVLEAIDGSLNDTAATTTATSYSATTTAAASTSGVVVTTTGGAGVEGVAEQRAKEFIKEQAEVPRFLLRDHRVETTGGLPPTMVRGCTKRNCK